VARQHERAWKRRGQLLDALLQPLTGIGETELSAGPVQRLGDRPRQAPVVRHAQHERVLAAQVDRVHVWNLLEVTPVNRCYAVRCFCHPRMGRMTTWMRANCSRRWMLNAVSWCSVRVNTVSRWNTSWPANTIERRNSFCRSWQICSSSSIRSVPTVNRYSA